jgi:tripartite-type tricarboxylate transporter receptor subunit TctC
MSAINRRVLIQGDILEDYMGLNRWLAVMLVAALLPSQARADAVADFYQGKTVTIYVGFGPGGGYDAYAQLLGQHIRRHIPGEPTVIVKHMPGAGSLTLMNYLWSVASSDGTAFGIPASSAAFVPLIGSSQEKAAAKFDAAEFTWLGSLEKFTPIGLAWHTTGIRTVDDVKQRPLRFGSSGAASGGELYAQLLNDMLGTKLVSIRGYRGSNDITLAIERGELDGFVGWCWTCMKADKPQYLNEKLVNVFVQFGRDADATAHGIPSALDLVTNPQDRQVMRLVLANLAMSRPFVAPPRLPAERTAALRRAFLATAADPAFLAAASRAKRDISVFTAEEIDTLLKESYALPADIVRRAAELSAAR